MEEADKMIEYIHEKLFLVDKEKLRLHMELKKYVDIKVMKEKLKTNSVIQIDQSTVFNFKK